MNEIKEKVGNEYKTRRATYRRLITVGGVEYPVPEGYTLLEYIESSGTQYIDTNYLPRSTMNFTAELDMALNDISVATFVGENNGYWFGTTTNNEWTIGGGVTLSGLDTSRHLCVFTSNRTTAKNGNIQLTVDGRTSPVRAYTMYSPSNGTYYLFAINNFSGIMPCKLYSAKLYGDGTLVRNFIPAKNSSNVVGMYDFVTNQFFPNAGTGVFTAGNALPNSQLYKYVGEIEKKVNGVYKEFSMGFPRTVSGASPITLPDARAKTLTKNKIYGNTKRTFDFHGVSYPIPSDITILDKIETDENATTEYSSGGCYLDTGIAANAITKVEIVAKEYNHNSQQYLFGAYQGSDAIYIDVKDDGGIYRAQLGEDSIDSEIEAADGFHDVVLDVSNRKFAIDGTEIGTFPSGGAAPSINAYALGMKTNYGYYCTSFYHRVIAIWKSTGLAFLGVSAKNASNVVGLYDFISGAFNAPTTGTATAGNAAPNPDMPLGVKGVGEKTEQLINNDDCQIITSEVATVNRAGWLLSLPAGETYTVSIGSDRAYARTKEGDSSWTNYASITPTSSYTFTSTESFKIHIYGSGTSTVEQMKSKHVQLVKGATAPTTYIPYGYKIEELLASNCGCVDMSTLNWNSIGNGCFYTAITGKANGRNIYCSKYPTDQVSMASATANMHIGGHEGNRVYFKNTTIEPTRAAVQNDLSGEYLYYQRTTDDTWTPPTKATAYLDNDLQGNATYKDTFDFADGVDTDAWDVKVLDGTEAWAQYTRNNGYVSFKLLNALVTKNDTRSQTICNYFIYYQFTSTSLNKICFSVGQGGTTLYFVLTDDYTLNTFKSFLAAQYAAGTPVKVWYPKITPSTTQKTAVQVTPAKGTNYLAVDCANIEASYIKKEYSAT